MTYRISLITLTAGTKAVKLKAEAESSDLWNFLFAKPLADFGNWVD